VLFGIQTLNRPNILIPALMIALLLAAARRWRAVLLMTAGLIAALAPITIRNFVVAGDWSPVSSHGGLNFYIGNNAEADGTYHLVAGITPNIAGQQQDTRRVAEQAVGRSLDEAEVSAYFYGQGWSWIREHPKQAATLFARKIFYTFSAAHISLNYSYPFYAYDARTLLAVLAVGPWLVVPLGLAGLIIAAPAPRRLDYAIWLSFVPVYAMAVATFFVSDRYRLPLLVPLCVGSGAAIDWLLTRRSVRLVPEGAVAVVFVALAIGANWPTGLDDGRSEARTRMAEAMVEGDRYDEAAAWTKRAEQGHPQPSLLHFRIGRLLLTHRKPEAAVAHLTRALELDPNQSAIDYALGQALVDAGRPSDAIPHLRKALSAGVRVDLAGFDLARALAATGDRGGALKVLRDVRPANPKDAQSWDTLGQLALQLQSPPLAAAFFAQAAEAAPRAAKPRQDLGLALAMMGRYKEAIANFEQAVLLDPADPVAQLNLAVTYAETGRKDDARAHAEEALRLKPDYERARQLIAALK
jgi:tetratricopeptide (TPR) repeat protein